jgi:15-cis-phytoene synthase
MRFDADLTACAALVQRADPDRFMAVMAAPVRARATLFPIYAMNVEVARAPWVTGEAMIAEIRLQWWRDALCEIAKGGVIRRHEVVTPLARVLSPQCAGDLDEMIAARSWDIYKDPFDSSAHMKRYIAQTTGVLIGVAVQSLGAADRQVVADFAYGVGLANWLRAVAGLRAGGRIPLPDDTPDAIRELAQGGLDRIARARGNRAAVSRAAAPALLVGWLGEPLLQQVMRDPGRVAAGTLGQGEIARRAGLMAKVVTRRW